jgi:flagellar basal body-associated protein FliL
MDTLLGLLGIVVWIVLVIAIAAAVTWLVVKISPAEKPKKAQAEG